MLALWSLSWLWHMATCGWAWAAGSGCRSNLILWIACLFSQSRAGGGNYSSKNPTSCLVTEQPRSAVVLVQLYNLAQFHPRLRSNRAFKFSKVALILLGLDLHDYDSLLFDRVFTVLEDSTKPMQEVTWEVKMRGILKLFQCNSAVENCFFHLDKHLLQADGLSVGNSQPVPCHFLKLLCSPKAALQSLFFCLWHTQS